MPASDLPSCVRRSIPKGRRCRCHVGLQRVRSGVTCRAMHAAAWGVLANKIRRDPIAARQAPTDSHEVTAVAKTGRSLAVIDVATTRGAQMPPLLWCFMVGVGSEQGGPAAGKGPEAASIDATPWYAIWTSS